MILLNNFSGYSSRTVRYIATDVAQVFTLADYTSASGLLASSATISCEDNDVRFALGGAIPTQGAGALGHVLEPRRECTLGDPSEITSFRFINRVNGSVGVIQVTFGFPIGG
jgi:hypothetical protein